jgi:hypothetical protein
MIECQSFWKQEQNDTHLINFVYLISGISDFILSRIMMFSYHMNYILNLEIWSVFYNQFLFSFFVVVCLPFFIYLEGENIESWWILKEN